MRLLLVVDVYPPSYNAAGLLMQDLAHAVVRAGHEVILVTPDPSITTSHTIEFDFGGVTVLRIRSGALKGESLARRAINEVRVSWVLWRGYKRSLAGDERIDAIVWYSPSIFLGPFVSLLKKKFGCHAYLILRDIFPDWAVDAGILRKGLVYRVFKWFEHYQYSVADVIAVQSPANLEHFATFSYRARLVVLFNWINLDKGPTRETKFYESLGLAGKKVFVFGGNIGVAPDMGNILRLAKRLGFRDDIRFLLIGTGSEVPYIKERITTGQLSNVVLSNGVEPEVFRGLLRQCRAGLITLDRRLRSHNIPGKLLAYLEAGLPVLASLNPGNDLRKILEESGAGFAYWNGEDAALDAAVLRLADDDALHAKSAASAMRLARERFSVTIASSQILEELRLQSSPE